VKFITKEPINKGWSSDKKYCVTDENGAKYLLRVSNITQHDTKQSEFNMMKQVSSLGVPMCQPIEFGTCDEGVYSIQSWIDGEDAEVVISGCSDTEQYAYGFEAGGILRKIHSIPAPATQEDWETRFNRKMDYKIKRYGECPIKYENAQAFIDYINENCHLLKNRTQVYQHGDYHIGNMMIDRSGNLHIIDFNRNDYGDPWEEFKSITWCAQASPLFASGMVNGYFDNNVPMDFWKLLALYISLGTIASLPWAIPYGEGEVQTMKTLANEVLSWYDNMRNPIPTWYFKGYYPKCYCGHDCSKCVTYIATQTSNEDLRRQAQRFYKESFGLDIPLEKFYCNGGRSKNAFELCKDCPFKKCCIERGVDACGKCSEYPCKDISDYQEKYVNKCNQLEIEKK